MNKSIKWILISVSAIALAAIAWLLILRQAQDERGTPPLPSPSAIAGRQAESGRWFWERPAEPGRRSGGLFGDDESEGSRRAAIPPPAPLERSTADRFSDHPIPTDIPEADDENIFAVPESFLVNVYKALLRHARSDPAVSSAALRRLAGRTWAYQSMWQISHGFPLDRLTTAPDASGWKDLTFLLFYAGNTELALESLQKAAPALSFTLKNYLEIVILQALGRNADQPVRKLLDDLEEFSAHAHLLVTNPYNRPALIFAHGADKPLQIQPRDDWTAAILGKIREAERLFEQRRFGRANFQLDNAGPIEMLADKAAPGQDIYFLIDESRRAGSEKAKFIQGRTEHPIHAYGAEYEITSYTGLSYWLRSATLPASLLPGPAEFRMGNFRKTIFVTPDPAPPAVSWMESRRVVAGEWVRVVARGIRNRADMIVSQEKKNWPASETPAPGAPEVAFGQIRPAEIVGDRHGSQSVLIRIPRQASTGMAHLRIRIDGRLSEPYPLEIADYPVPLNERTRIRSPELTGMAPEEKFFFQFANPADDYAALCLMPSGEFVAWSTDGLTDTGRIPRGGIWRVPPDWPPGAVWIIWAERRGEHWLVPSLTGERVTVGPVAGRPEIHNAAFHRAGGGVYTAFDPDKNKYVTDAFKKGDLTVRGMDIWPNDPYAVKVIFERGGEFPLTAKAHVRGLMTVNLDPNGPNPNEVHVAKVVRNRPGEFTMVPVHDASASDVLDAQTPQGKVAVEWLQKVSLLMHRDGQTIIPSPEDLLRRLTISTLPHSPWGGHWKYSLSADGATFAFLAFDMSGKLRAQYMSDGSRAEWIEYDLMSAEGRGESAGNLSANALWTATGLGNLVADAIRTAAEAQMSLYPAHNLRGNLPAGAVSSAMIERVFVDPQDQVTILQMKGRQIKELVIKSLDEEESVYGSGFTAQIDDPTDPQQVRITLLAGGPVWDEQVYTVALPQHLADIVAGGAGLTTELRVTAQAALEQHLRRHSTLTPDERGRVTLSR